MNKLKLSKELIEAISKLEEVVREVGKTYNQHSDFFTVDLKTLVIDDYISDESGLAAIRNAKMIMVVELFFMDSSNTQYQWPISNIVYRLEISDFQPDFIEMVTEMLRKKFLENLVEKPGAVYEDNLAF